MLQELDEIGFVGLHHPYFLLLLFDVKGEILLHHHHFLEDHPLAQPALAPFIIDLVLDLAGVIVPLRGRQAFRLHPLSDIYY